MSRDPTIGMFVGDEEIERRRQKRLNQIEPVDATTPPDFTEQARELDSGTTEAKGTKTYKEENKYFEQAQQLVLAWKSNDFISSLNMQEDKLIEAIASFAAEAATAALEQAAQNRPKIICLCGSTRFVQTWIDEYQRLSDEGNIVLTVARMPPRPNLQHDEPELKRKLDGLHFHKIALADEVFILNVGGYIGESTAREIEHAMNLKKTIRWLEQPIAAIGDDRGK